MQLYSFVDAKEVDLRSELLQKIVRSQVHRHGKYSELLERKASELCRDWLRGLERTMIKQLPRVASWMELGNGEIGHGRYKQERCREAPSRQNSLVALAMAKSMSGDGSARFRSSLEIAVHGCRAQWIAIQDGSTEELGAVERCRYGGGTPEGLSTSIRFGGIG